ncbi:hypothetical protein IQ265_12585 [Nodosilinea sp. LEGE 06152]|uniref:hypothetical protein n=1 Tax=Nodosilinea sp. LEGE 06152 TaxID=2777966 RepID=UPI001882EA1A|nr:hypothetical protein [Nodosilinea sp. LEGE 06152]MBE9157656.1 hypothetical protein [Nodosilinea sp. LEGE 06152]
MLWLSIGQTSEALDPIAVNSRPWATLEKFWRFCKLYGDYQATPPRLRRQFIINLEQARKNDQVCGEVEPCAELPQ